MSQVEQTQGTTGRLLAGRYRLAGVLGRGGMGTVWRAEDETLGRTVAVKELRFPSSVDEDEKRRLVTRTLREAKAIARIRNNGAVTVYDVVDEDDRPWIVMELIEGSSLADVVREAGGISPRRAAEVGLAVLDVLRAAHRQGILHRDVKPSNVLISDDGRVVLTDFGIAQVEGDPSVTSTGMLVGAPSYISPERARGQKPGPPADLWSLGGLLYACVEGVPPYDKGSALATLTAVMTEPLEPPQHAGPLEDVIYGLLVKDPERRLDDAGARALLDAALQALEEPAEAPEPTRTMTLPAEPVAEAADAKSPETETAGAAATTGAEAGKPERSRRAAADERVRSALRSVRNAAAASRATAPESPAAPSGDRARPERAALTDVVSRRTLAIIAVVVALAVLGTALLIALNNGGGKDDHDPAAKGGKATSASKPGSGGDGTGASPSKSPEDEPSKSAGGDDGGQGNDDSGESKGDGGHDGGLPEGFTTVKDGRFHFSMAMPDGWKQFGTAGQNSGGKYAEDGGYPRIQVDFGTSPTSDAAAAWRDARTYVSSHSEDYHHLGIEKVTYRDYPTTADWSFERDEDGRRMRVLNRGFKVDAHHGYAIMITCRKDEWDGKECSTLRKTAFDTFRPTD